jgi:hypothetical protein
VTCARGPPPSPTHLLTNVGSKWLSQQILSSEHFTTKSSPPHFSPRSFAFLPVTKLTQKEEKKGRLYYIPARGKVLYLTLPYSSLSKNRTVSVLPVPAHLTCRCGGNGVFRMVQTVPLNRKSWHSAGGGRKSGEWSPGAFFSSLSLSRLWWYTILSSASLTLLWFL